MPVLSERSASLQDADPRLAAALVAGGASALAHAPLLPVLTLEPGDWEPPEPGLLGPQTARLAVLAGWLWHTGGEVFGPGDAVDPWDGGGAWRACTGARLAVIGAAFAGALEAARDVAGAGATPRARVLRLAGEAAGEAPEERLLAALWRLAARWGLSAADGPALPHELDTAALAGLLDVTREQADAALTRLLAGGTLRRRGDGGWQLPPPAHTPGQRGRRDHLRARMAEQLALSRVITEEARLLADALRTERLRAASRAARRRSA